MASPQPPPASDDYQWPPQEHEYSTSVPIEFMDFSSPSMAEPLPLPLTLSQYVYTEPIVSTSASIPPLTFDEFLSCDFSMKLLPSLIPSGTEPWFLDPSEGAITVHDENKTCLAFYQCRICLETAKQPVVTSCGHLYCWPCLYCRMYLLEKSQRMNGIKTCPVCCSEISESLMFPIEAKDEGETLFSEFVAPRPRGIRLAPRS